MISDSALLVRDHLVTLPKVTALVGDQVFEVGDAPDGPGSWGILAAEIDGGYSESLVLRTPLVQVTAFSADRSWSRRVTGAVIDTLGAFCGWMGSVWVVSTYQAEAETREAIGGVYRWAYSADFALKYQGV